MKNKITDIPARKGFSLIELMVAFTILALSMLSITGLISYGHRGTQKDFRSVIALQLLEGRMNQLLAITYKKIDVDVMTDPAVFTQTLTSPIFVGEPCEIKFGKEIVDKTEYTINATLTRYPVTFTLNRLTIDPTYEFDKVETYKFEGSTSNAYDGSDAKHPYKVIKVVMNISWNERIVNVTRTMDVTSFIVDMEE